jgi:hypothetical protein
MSLGRQMRCSIAIALAIPIGLVCLAATPAFAAESILFSQQRSSCALGSCPAYRIDLFADGTLRFEGLACTVVAGRRESRVSRRIVKAVQAAFSKYRFSSLRPSCCSCRGRTEEVTVMTTWYGPDGPHVVSHYRGCASAPAAIRRLETTLERLLDVSAWTGSAQQIQELCTGDPLQGLRL